MKHRNSPMLPPPQAHPATSKPLVAATRPKPAQVTKAGRQVYISLHGPVWMVLYLSRKKHGRYSAAQFASDTHSLVDVEAWVASQPHLFLSVEKLN